MKRDYIAEHSASADQVLEWIEKQTHLRTNHSRMLCGPVVGKFLEFFVSNLSYSTRSNNRGSGIDILEIGAFTGYSSVCMARGLSDNGHLYSIEINDELEDLILRGHKMANLENRISLLIGDAKEMIEKIGKKFDLIFMDANKREYVTYYNLVFPYLKKGGYLIADNVLWSNKVLEEPMPHDAQTQGIHSFNEFVKNDKRVENIIIPLRDGLNIIRKLSD